MRRILPFLTLMLALSSVNQGWADSLTAAKKAGIRHLMMLTGATKIETNLSQHLGSRMRQILESDSSKVPDQVNAIIDFEVKQLVEERFGQLEAEMVRIYANHFSHEEIKQLIAFYRSEVGKKSLRELPAIIIESREAGKEWGQEIFTELAERIEAKLAAGGDQLTQ